jgi:hypothetical protein
MTHLLPEIEPFPLPRGLLYIEPVESRNRACARIYENRLHSFRRLDRQQQEMEVSNRPHAVIHIFLLLLAFGAAPLSHAAERGLEKVRIAVSSMSLGFLDIWAAKARGFFRTHGLDATAIEEVLRERR